VGESDPETLGSAVKSSKEPTNELSTIRCVRLYDTADFNGQRWEVVRKDDKAATITIEKVTPSIFDNSPALWNLNEAARIYIASEGNVLACRVQHHTEEGPFTIVHYARENAIETSRPED
jgi:hypothetical protein